MTIRNQALLAAIALLGFAGETLAQPIAPARRPTFGNYSSLFYPGGGYYGYGFGGPGGYGGAYGAMGFGGMGYGGGFGWGGPRGGFGGNAMMMQQNLQLQQQLNNFNQNLANLQTQIATGVNPNFPSTGHAAVFNYLGHWYPMGTGSGMSGGGMMGGVMGGAMMGGLGRGTAGIGYPVGGAAGGAGRAPGMNAGAPNRTAGTGTPIGGVGRGGRR